MSIGLQGGGDPSPTAPAPTPSGFDPVTEDLTVPQSAADGLPAWVDYVVALGPLFILTGAVVAAVMAWRSTQRDRWWTRTQWAAGHVLSDNEDAQALGLAVLQVQVDHVRSDEEAQLIGAVSDTLYDGLIADFVEDSDVEYVLEQDDGQKGREGDDGG